MRLEETLKQHHVDIARLSLPEYQRAGEDHPIYLLQVPAFQALVYSHAMRNELVEELIIEP